MSKKDKKILEQSYTIEVLEDEIGDLEKVVALKQARIIELINENDRLTMTYEPYRPPGDEYEGLGFYDLIEENDSLTNNVLEKIEAIKELDEEIILLKRSLKECQAKTQELDQTGKATEKDKKPRRKYAGCLSFDFWPISDWFRFKIYRWNAARTFQVNVGPIRFDFFEV